MLEKLTGFLGRIKLQDRTFFARQLSTMLESGLPIAQSLTIIASQTKNKKFKTIINKIIEDIESGVSFSTAISGHPEAFSNVEISIIRAGEASGKLTNVLSELALDLETQSAFGGKIKSALMYPLFILVTMIVVVYIMMTRVLPQLLGIFKEANVPLPWSTRVLIATTDFASAYWWLIILVTVGSIVGARLYFTSDQGSITWAKITLETPVFAGLNQRIYMANMCRTLGMLSQSGVPIVESIQIVSSVIDNKIYSKSLVKAARDVERGVPLSVPVSKSSYFPAIVGQMILVGEQTGKMDEILIKLAAYFEQEVDTELKGVISLVEPAMLIIIGLGVAIIVFAILVPIYSIAQTI